MLTQQINRGVRLWIAAMLLVCSPVMANGDNRIENAYSIIDTLVRNNENLLEYFANHGITMSVKASCSYSAMLGSEKNLLRDGTAIVLDYFVSRRAKKEFTLVVNVDEKNNCITADDITSKYDFDFVGTNIDPSGYGMLYETSAPSFYHLHFMFYGKDKQCFRGVELITSDENLCHFRNGLQR